jgi:hypothetical protein
VLRFKRIKKVEGGGEKNKGILEEWNDGMVEKDITSYELQVAG